MSHLMGEWLVDTIVSDIRKVFDGRIPLGRDHASNNYVQDMSSGFRVVSRSHVPKLVKISKLHYKGKVTAGTISDTHVAVHARFSDDAIRRYNEDDPSHKGRRPIIGYILITDFELNVSRHGDVDQRISLVIRGFIAKGGRSIESGVSPPLARHPLVKEVVGLLLGRKFPQTSNHAEAKMSPSQSKAGSGGDDPDDEPRSQVSDPPENSQSQGRFATQAIRGHAGSKTQAKVQAGGINLSGPKEALRTMIPKGKATPQYQLLDLLKKHPQTAGQPMVEDVLQTTKGAHAHGPPSVGLYNQVKSNPQPPIATGDSISLHNGTFLFATAVPTRLLEIPSNQAKLLDQKDSWRSVEHGHRAPGLDVPEETLVALESMRKLPQPPTQGSQSAVLLGHKTSPPQSRHSEDSEDAQSSSKSGTFSWADSEHEMTVEPTCPKNQLPPDSSLESGAPSISAVAVDADVESRQTRGVRPSTSVGRSNIGSSPPTKVPQPVMTSPVVRTSTSRYNGMFSPRVVGTTPRKSPEGSGLDSSPLRTSKDMVASSSRQNGSCNLCITSRTATIPPSPSGYRLDSSKEQTHISLDSTDLTAQSGSGAKHSTPSSRPVVSLDGGFDESIPRSSKAGEKSSSNQASQALGQLSLSHRPQAIPEGPAQSEEGQNSHFRHKASRSLSSQGETQPPAKRQRLAEQPLTTSTAVDPAQVLRQQRRDFIGTRKSEYQQLHNAAQPTRPSRRATGSDTESVQIISTTAVGNHKKEPVVVVNSTVNSPPRKTTQKPGTKPQSIVPRCVPCRSTHKVCEAGGNDLDGPCQRCAKLGFSCKLSDGTTRIRNTTNASAEGVSLPQSQCSQTRLSSSPATSQHHAAVRSYSSRRTSPASSNSRLQDSRGSEPKPIPREPSKAGDRPSLQPMSSARNPQQLALYETFRLSYPDYRGDQKHFIGRCRAIDKLHAQEKLHKSLWDDHLIRHKTEYAPYAARCNDAGHDARPYEQFYNESCDAPKYTAMLLKPDTLPAALSVWPTTASDQTGIMEEKASPPAMVSVTDGWQPPRQPPRQPRSGIDETGPRSVHRHASEHFSMSSEARRSPAWRDPPYRAQGSDRYDDPYRYNEPYRYNNPYSYGDSHVYHDRHLRGDLYHASSRSESRHSDGASFGRDDRDRHCGPYRRSPTYRPYDRISSSSLERPPWDATRRPATGSRTSARITPLKRPPERRDDPSRANVSASSPGGSNVSVAKAPAAQSTSHATPSIPLGRHETTSPSSKGVSDTRDNRRHASLRDQPRTSLPSTRETPSNHDRTPTTSMNAVREVPLAVTQFKKRSHDPLGRPRSMQATEAPILANKGIQLLSENRKLSRRPPLDRQESLIMNTIPGDNNDNGIQLISSPSDIGPGSEVPVEWWRKDNTVFKEFARSFIGLKAFGGFSKHVTERIDVLAWQL